MGISATGIIGVCHALGVKDAAECLGKIATLAGEIRKLKEEPKGAPSEDEGK